MGIIQPRTLKGFRDFLPAQMIPRERLIAIAQQVYRSYGFNPIDTPVLEYYEILAGKGSDETDRQMYRFEDNGGRKVGMRFDLTVPLARFAAQHAPQLGLPFKRYHIGLVWRGEKQQRGRYREFMQCDFDTIGTKSLVSDTETGLVIHDLLRALGFDRFTICINHRGVLNGLLQQLSLADHSVAVLRALDKRAKAGRDKVAEELQREANTSTQQTEQILEFSEISGTHTDVLNALDSLVGQNELAAHGIQQMRGLVEGAAAAGVESGRLKLDVSIARGLDYYTGVVFETYLDDMVEIGSVCSGGRYDNLAGLYTKQELPGVGASLGLDRLLAAMEEMDLLGSAQTSAEVLILLFDAKFTNEYLSLAAKLRAAGIATEVYPDTRKIKQQMKYADQRGFSLAVIAGEDEFAAGTCTLKQLATGEQSTVPVGQLVEEVRGRLNPAKTGE